VRGEDGGGGEGGQIWAFFEYEIGDVMARLIPLWNASVKVHDGSPGEACVQPILNNLHAFDGQTDHGRVQKRSGLVFDEIFFLLGHLLLS
jgi:hypothetical protein